MSDHLQIQTLTGPEISGKLSKSSGLRVGVMGYYGYGNAGDDIILEAIRHLFSTQQVVPFQVNFSPSKADIHRLNAFDFLILGGGGLYNKTPPGPFATFHEWHQLLETPIGGLGLGVEKLERQYLAATHKLVEKAEFFIVRDAESKRLVDHPKVDLAPDLTFIQPLPASVCHSRKQQLRAGINLRPTGDKVTAWVDAVKTLPCEKVAVPFSVVPTYDDREPLRLIDPACPDRFRSDLYQDLDLFVGTAFHSIVFAIQSGVPAIAISYHPKVHRLMSEIGLNEYVLQPDQQGELLARYEHLLDNWAEVRDKMMTYCQQSQAEWRQLAPGIRQKVVDGAGCSSKTNLPKLESPTVTILVHAGLDDPDETLAQTIESCCSQTHPNKHILVLDEASDRRSMVLPCVSNSCHVDANVVPDDDWVATGLAKAQGNLVTWIEAGSRFVPDAIESLVTALQECSSFVGAGAAHYLTAEGVLERKINPSIDYGVGQTLSLPKCLLITREAASLLRQKRQKADIHAVASRLVYLSHGLLLVPSAQSDLDLYRAAVAYGRGQNGTGSHLLQRAFQADAGLGSVTQKQELAFGAFLDAAFNPLVTNDPVAFLANVSGYLPSKSVDATHFKKAFRGRALMEVAYLSAARGKRSVARRMLLRAFAADPRWFRRRGAWAFLLQMMLSRRALAIHQRAKARLGFVSPPKKNQ